MISSKVIEELSGGDEVLHYSAKKLEEFNIKEEDKKILSQVGIPRFAAPAIDFLRENRGGLDRLSKYYGSNEQLSKYMVLANCEEGIVVLNESTDEIDMIKSDSLESVFVNSTLEQFINSLYCYNRMTSKVVVQSENAHKYIDNVTKEDIDHIRKEISYIDDMAFSSNSFWYLTFADIFEEKIFSLMQ